MTEEQLDYFQVLNGEIKTLETRVNFFEHVKPMYDLESLDKRTREKIICKPFLRFFKPEKDAKGKKKQRILIFSGAECTYGTDITIDEELNEVILGYFKRKLEEKRKEFADIELNERM